MKMMPLHAEGTHHFLLCLVQAPLAGEEEHVGIPDDLLPVEALEVEAHGAGDRGLVLQLVDVDPGPPSLSYRRPG